MTEQQQIWQPLLNGYNTGRIGNFEIQVGIESGKLHIFNINKNRACWTLDLPAEIALCRTVADEDEIEDAPPPHVTKAMSQIAIYAATYGTDSMYLRDPVVAKPIAVVQEWLKQWGYTFEGSKL